MAEQTAQINDERRIRIRQFLRELIAKDAEMKEAVSNAKNSFKEWQTHESALMNSNDRLLLELKNLQTEINNSTQQIKNKTDKHRELDDEFKKYEQINKLDDEEFWKCIVAEMDKYRDLFTKAEVEYNSDSLKNDIERYREISKEVDEEIGRIKQEKANLINIYGLIELGSNERANSLQDLQQLQKTLMENDKSLSLLIRSAENELQKLNSKLRQKKRDIENSSRKTKQ